MNYNTENVVAAAAAASQHHHHHHHQYHHQQDQHIIPLPSYSSSQSAGTAEIGGSGSGGGGGDSSPKNMEWTNDDALELIEQYRCHTELWNRADPKYKDKLCRFRAWSEIAERFGCSKAEVERKMNVLLTQYRREKHKMFVKIYQGIQPNPSKWYAFKRFDFMEAGGGSLSGLPSGAVANSSTSSTSSASHNGLNGLAAAAVAAAAYESSTIAAAANGGAPGGGPSLSATGATTPASQHHRRIKTKELKYFGAMALNIPMLIASGQTLDSWNTAGQYSPPIGSAAAAAGGGGVSNSHQQQQQQQQLRVPLAMPYVGAATPYAGGGGGGSSSSEYQPSPHKTIENASDNEDNNNRDEATAAALGQLAAKVERRTPSLGAGGGTLDVGVAVEPGGETVAAAAAAAAALSEAGSSPIPNTNTNPHANPGTTTTNMHEAHKQQHQHQHPHHHHHHPHPHLLQTSPVSARAATPRQAHEQLPQHHHHHGHHSDELDIKQELVDYFHGTPNAAATGAAQQQQQQAVPTPLDSHRSYSSAGEESRSLQLDMAQDLRVAQAKAQASFGGFVLPPRSNSAQLAAMPLNMRKLSSNAGQLLMSSLMSSRESMSEDGEADNDEATESAASPGHIKSSVSAQDASSAVQAAAALYAESLSRDDCDFVGSNVSMKLRTMDRTQRIIAEKLISEVLYFGQFNELERTARIQPK
ncbi:hypothetical protein KR044_006688 [Drosophila immigrans]|nr:hypothetical protein KR044_006688 [Drosophila immigrans]